MNTEIKIDKEFKGILDPLTNEEKKGLKALIIKEGCREPLIIWKGENILIDGHNRYEICTTNNPIIEYKVVEMEFKSREDVITWIIQTQLSRRNLTDERRAYYIGKFYKAEKKSHGASKAEPRGNQHTKQTKSSENLVSSQNANLPENEKTVKNVAKQHNVSKDTVIRNEKFADGVDKIGEVSPEAKEKVLQGKSNLTKKEVIKLAEAPKEEVKKVVEQIKNNEPKKGRPKNDPEFKAQVARLHDRDDVCAALNLVYKMEECLTKLIPAIEKIKKPEQQNEVFVRFIKYSEQVNILKEKFENVK